MIGRVMVPPLGLVTIRPLKSESLRDSKYSMLSCRIAATYSNKAAVSGAW